MTIVNAVEAVSTNNQTFINIVLDETGSMEICRQSTISSFNEYIQSQKAQPGDCFVSLTMFSTKWNTSDGPVRTVYKNIPISEVQDLTLETFVPDGGTNLYDAIGKTINGIESTPDSNMLMVIITDGDENSSREFKLEEIKSMVQEKEKQGWTFVYLGANQDAWQVGASFGLARGQTMTYDTSNMHGTMATLNAATSVYRSTRAYSKSAEKNFFGDNNDQ